MTFAGLRRLTGILARKAAPRPLPRAIRRLTPPDRDAWSWVYVDLHAPRPWMFDPSPRPHMTHTVETQVLDARGTRAASSMAGPLDDVIDLTGHALAAALDRLAVEVRAEGRVVEPGDEPDLRVLVRVEASVKTWPKVPGVTGLPYRPLGIVLSVSTPVDVLYRAWMTGVEDHWRVVWMHHPRTLDYLPGHVRDYFPGGWVADEDVPPGQLVLAAALQ